MNVCIDIRPALSHSTGVGVYLENLISALGEIDQESQYHLFSSSWRERFPEKNFGDNFAVHDRHIPVRLLNYAWNRLSFPPIESLLKTSVDVVHSPTPLVIPTRNARKITTVHDLYFWFYPDEVTGEIRRDYSELLRPHCLKSDAIITVSNHTRRMLTEVVQVPPSKVFAIHHGVDAAFSIPVSERAREDVRAKWNLDRPYFLFVGTLQPRKNLRTLLNAFENLKQDVQLVIAGLEGWNGSIAQEKINRARIVYAGYVSKEELRVLYQDALAFVFPSLEEGFGLPLLEAMASGTPVIASRIPAFQEVAADACLSFDPQDPGDLAQSMDKICADQALRAELIKKGKERAAQFSWKVAAAKTLEIYRALARV